MSAESFHSTQAAPRGDKRTIRQSRLLKAIVHCSRYGQVGVTIRNISEYGIGGRAPFELNLNELVMVELAGQSPVRGIVRWTFDGGFGIQTEHALDLAALRGAHGGALPCAGASVRFDDRPAVVHLAAPVAAPFGQGIRIG